VKESYPYKTVHENHSRIIESGHDVPLTPDAEDQTVSKRSWETHVQTWRAKIREMAGPDEEVIELSD